MAVSRGISNIILSILGVFVVLGIIIFIASMLGSSAPIRPLIYKSIELQAATNPVEKADLITTIDDLVMQTNNEDIKDQWDRMLPCLGTVCPDEAYLDLSLVTIAAFEKEVPESTVLINIIATGKYWNDPDRILEFSKALTLANEQVEDLDNRKAERIWDQIVECNGECSEKNSLYFELVKAIVK